VEVAYARPDKQKIITVKVPEGTTALEVVQVSGILNEFPEIDLDSAKMGLFGKGLLITAIGTVCYVATWQVAYPRLAPDYLDKYAAYQLEKARESGATEAQIAEETKKMAEFKEMYKNPLVNIAFTFLEPLPVGIVFTLVTAGVLSRKRRVDVEAIA
jgi:hypothetical protein